MKIKTERVNAELARQITEVIASEIKDPRLSGAIVGVTKVYTTPDLKFAKVYLSIYASDAEKTKEAFDTICRSKVFIRNMLKDRVQIRLLPDLTFLIDDSVEYGAKIEKLIQQIHSSDAQNSQSSHSEDNN